MLGYIEIVLLYLKKKSLSKQGEACNEKIVPAKLPTVLANFGFPQIPQKSTCDL